MKLSAVKLSAEKARCGKVQSVKGRLAVKQRVAQSAGEALAYLKEHGVTVRGLSGYRMPNHLRVSVGTVEGNDAALKHLKDFLGK